jgi:hypothetical protein
MLDVRFENPMDKFTDLLKIYDKFIESKFSHESFTYLCAYVLLTSEPNSDLQTRIDRSMSLYKGMKSNHLTQLNHNKLFKWHKDINLLMAINYLMSEKMDDPCLIGTNMYTIDHPATASCYGCYRD